MKRILAAAALALIAVAPAHADTLADQVKAGQFRSDLYYRLSGLTITVPPLRERREEILPLAELFLTKTKRPMKLGEDARALLASHSFPGNVRELRLAIERAGALATGMTIGADDLALDEPSPESETEDSLLAALEAAAGNQSEAARRLGISRRTLVGRLADIKKKRGA